MEPGSHRERIEHVETLWIPYDQLSHRQIYLAEPSPDRVILLVELDAFFRSMLHHRVKIAFFISAMRHFARELEKAGWKVDLHRHHESERMETALSRHIERFAPERILVPEPNDHGIRRALPVLSKKCGVPIERLPYAHFLTDREDFLNWADGKKQLRMETHYRRMRKARDILVDSKGEPEGGAWNFDSDNRQGHKDWVKAGSPSTGAVPKPRTDKISLEVMSEVNAAFPKHPGDAARLWLPVTRQESLEWLKHFVTRKLASFGPYEDMMAEGEPVLFHSVLSPMLNLGLLDPAECIEAAVAEWKKGGIPMASLEGFVRQILGWREFVNGVYWLKMPAYPEENTLEATRPLPAWAWTGDTEMHCVSSVIRQLLDLGYNHHIQRLMILGNYFLLSGIRPKEVLEWFTAMYVDAHHWVMAANVIGMVLYADGGSMSTKPYAAGPAYISKMSNYCAKCRFNPTKREGPDACPFHALYWNFIATHQARFQTNPRMLMMVASWKKKNATEQERIQKSAQSWLDAEACA